MIPIDGELTLVMASITGAAFVKSSMVNVESLTPNIFTLQEIGWINMKPDQMDLLFNSEDWQPYRSKQIALLVAESLLSESEVEDVDLTDADINSDFVM